MLTFVMRAVLRTKRALDERVEDRDLLLTGKVVRHDENNCIRKCGAVTRLAPVVSAYPQGTGYRYGDKP